MKSSYRLHTVLISLLVIILCLSMIPVIAMAAQETRTENGEINFVGTKQDNPADEEDGDIRVPIGSLPSTEPSESVHVHDWVSFDAVEPNCDFEGNIAYKVCSSCGEAQNAAGETIAKDSWILPALGHKWEDIAAVAPTCDTDGNIAYQRCSVCGAAQTAGENPIPLGKFGWVDFATGHNYVDGICSVCSAKDPEYVPPYILGDVNNDTTVNNDDVVLLLWFSLFPEDYTIIGNGDLNHDGQINNDDVVLLLWHTLFPDDYPLS